MQGIFARLQDGAGYPDVAAKEGFCESGCGRSSASGRRGRGYDGPDHKRMQMAPLTPALRLAADGVARGNAKSIPLLLQIIDRLDRYSDPLEDFNSPELFMERRGKPSARRGKPAGMKTVGDALGRSAAERPERTSPEQGLENAQNGKG